MVASFFLRDSPANVDIGFAFLPRHWSYDYATEAATAVLGLPRIVAITAPDNHGSINVLKEIGLRFDKRFTLADDGGEALLFTPDGVGG